MSDRVGAQFLGVCCLILGGLVFRAVGCDRPRVPTYPVKGIVIFKHDRQPLPGGAIVVAQGLDPPKLRALGIVQEDGTFVLETERKADGAIAGEQVIIFNPGFESPPDALRGKIDARYLNLSTTPLRITVQPSSENYFELEIEKPATRR